METKLVQSIINIHGTTPNTLGQYPTARKKEWEVKIIVIDSIGWILRRQY